ncbi:MAG: hypothetical protein GX287_02620 [Fusobacteria bacterium]|nr:hypothetical protein [Fusobacteriota bacterium]
MKKTIALVAGLFLVCNTVFMAEGANDIAKKLESKTKWDFSESNVEFEARLYDSTVDAQGVMGVDTDFILKLKKQVDDKTTVTFVYDTDDSNPDEILELLVNRKFNEYLEAQIDIDILVGDGFAVREDDKSDKVWIKYRPSKKSTIKFAPYDIRLKMGDEFETSGAQKTPGIQLDYDINDNSTVIVGLGAKMVNETGGADPLKPENDIEAKEYTSVGYKLGYDYKGEGFNISALVTGTTQDEKNITRQQAASYDLSASVIGDFELGNFGIGYEFAFQDLNETAIADETDFGAYINVSYNIEDKNLTPFIAYRYVGEYLYFDDDDYSATFADFDHGGLNSIEIGTDIHLKGGFVLTPSYEFVTIKNDAYTDTKGKATDNASFFTIKAKVEF